jgi:hypothetical protein
MNPQQWFSSIRALADGNEPYLRGARGRCRRSASTRAGSAVVSRPAASPDLCRPPRYASAVAVSVRSPWIQRKGGFASHVSKISHGTGLPNRKPCMRLQP